MTRRLLLSLFLIAAAACSTGGPTESDRAVSAGPAMDGGVMHGSGNRTDSTTVNTTAAGSGEPTTTEAERAGVMHGSGN